MLERSSHPLRLCCPVGRLDKMRIKNTSRYPTVEVERLVRFAAKGIESSRVEVHVKNSKWVLLGERGTTLDAARSSMLPWILMT